MAISTVTKTSESTSGVGAPLWTTTWNSAHPWAFSSSRREAALNWIALGLLLAAWNASDNDAVEGLRRRPESLRGYSYVSVRAATLHSAELRAASMN